MGYIGQAEVHFGQNMGADWIVEDDPILDIHVLP